MNSRISVAILAGASLLPFAAPAIAQNARAPADQASAGLEEIVVTARKREESLLNVPVSVTALGEKALARYNATDLIQIAQLVPQLTITNVASGSGASLSIRGIGSVGDDPGVDQSVGVYIDNVGIGRGRIISAAMFDMSQVEVLKGPQALFFGKNSPAGVVSLTSAGPGNRFEGRVTAGYEFAANERYLEAAAGGPVSDTLGVRLAVRAEGMDGWMRNRARPLVDPLTGLMTPGAGKRAPKTKKLAGRLTLKYEPSTDFSAVVKIFASYTKINDPTGLVDNKCLPGVVFSVAGVPDPTVDCLANRIHSNTGINPALAENWPHANGGKLYGKTNIQSGSLNLNYGSGPLTVTSVTAYSRLEYHDLFNASISSYEALIPQSNELTKTFSQELRLNSSYEGPLNFTAGAYYERQTRKAPNSVALLFLGPDIRTGAPRNWNFTREAGNKGNTISAFGQLRWNIQDNLELAGGVRYTRDRKKVTLGNSFVNSNAIATFGPAFFLPEGTFLHGDFEDSNWSPEATLTWHPDTNQTAYAAYKTGYKSGGFSNTLLLGGGFNIGNLTYAPETTKGGEIGYKAKLFDNKVRFEAAIYSYKFKGLQLASFDSATFSYFIKNAAAARTSGVEVSGQWKVMPELTLRGDASYNRGKFLSYPGAPCYQGQTAAQGCVIGPGGANQNPAGQALPRAPKWTLGSGFSYDMPLTSDLTVGIDGDAQYKSQYNTDNSLAPFVIQKGYWLLNGAVRLTSERTGVEVSLIGRNLTNKLYYSFTTDSGLAPVGVWNTLLERGRQVAVQAKLNF